MIRGKNKNQATSRYDFFSVLVKFSVAFNC